MVKSVFVEDLGYFSAFKMVYNFESAAYATEVGAVSQPFRTRFGFHVVKVLEKTKIKRSSDCSSYHDCKHTKRLYTSSERSHSGIAPFDTSGRRLWRTRETIF